MSGKLKKQIDFINIKNLEINLSDFSKGIYLLKLKTDINTFNEKLILK